MVLLGGSDFKVLGKTAKSRYKTCLFANLEMAQLNPTPPCAHFFTYTKNSRYKEHHSIYTG